MLVSFWLQYVWTSSNLAKQPMRRMEVLGLQNQCVDSWGYRVWSVLKKYFSFSTSMTWTLIHRAHWNREYENKENNNMNLLLDKEKKSQTYKGPKEGSASIPVSIFSFSSPSVSWRCLCSQVTTNHP